MAKKLEALAVAKEAPFGKVVLESATQIWLAGLGAFSKAQDEGTKIFDSLVKEGERFQKHARGAAEDAVADVRDRAADTWDKLEDVFEDRVSRALNKLSVPTKKDVEALRDKVEELTAAVEKLAGSEVHNAVKPIARGRGRGGRPHANA
jgi:poly(hydroxyalkanoate) granule-associated protein